MKKDENLSPHEMVANMLAKTNEVLKNLQNSIDNPLPAKGPFPQPTGPLPVVRTPNMVADEKKRLLILQKNTIKDTSKKVDDYLKNQPLNTQLRCYKQVFRWEKDVMSEEIQKSDDHLEKKEYPDTISSSQQIGMEILHDEKHISKQVAMENFDGNRQSILDYYNSNLSFNNLQTDVDHSLEKSSKTIEEDLDKD